jgi:hypothetical protein
MALRILMALCLCIACYSTVFSQQTNSRDSITLVTNFFTGTKFYQGNQRITMRQVTEVMGTNPQALTYLKKAKTNNTISIIFGVIGGALVGYELGRAAGGGDINGAVIAAGAGCIVFSIPFSIAGGKNTKKAVNTYNAAFR